MAESFQRVGALSNSHVGRDFEAIAIKALAAYETLKIDIAFATGMLLGYSRVQVTMSKP